MAPEMEWEVETQSVWRNMKYRFRPCSPCVAECERFYEHVRGDQCIRNDDLFPPFHGFGCVVNDCGQDDHSHAGVARPVVAKTVYAQAESDTTDDQYADDEDRKCPTVFPRP